MHCKVCLISGCSVTAALWYRSALKTTIEMFIKGGNSVQVYRMSRAIHYVNVTRVYDLTIRTPTTFCFSC